MRVSNVLSVVGLASTIYAQNVTHCEGGACYAINVPESTASTGTGDIFMQISGPTSFSWIGLGQSIGEDMTGANIFMIYANAAGTNVTLSPRMGVGQRQPKPGSMAEVELLSGSGIENEMMTANIKCSNCNSWNGGKGSMNLTDPNSMWIFAMHAGAPVSSDSVDANLPYHTARGTVNFNLAMATGGSGANPFTAAAAMAPMAGGSASSTPMLPSNFETIRLTHGVLMGIAFVIIMPLGSILMRTLSFKNQIWVHAGFQLLAYTMALAAMGLGIWLAVTLKYFDKYHSIIGFVAVCGLFIQPITGLLHHIIWKKKHSRTVTTYAHLWWGRALVTLAMINGGFGLQLTQAYQPGANKGIIVWSVVAGVIWLFWMSVIVMDFFRRRKHAKDSRQSSVTSNRGEKAANH